MLNWVETDVNALRHNVWQFRRRVGPKVLLAPVVKSNAYGHGLEIAVGTARTYGRSDERLQGLHRCQ
jgi:alanine racemase